MTERGELTCTHSLEMAEGGTHQESNHVRDTHFLETAEGGTSQDMEKKATEGGGLTFTHTQRGGQVRIWEESN